MRRVHVAILAIASVVCFEASLLAQGATGNIVVHKVEKVGSTDPPCSGDLIKLTGAADVEVAAGRVDSVVFKLTVKSSPGLWGPFTHVATAATGSANMVGFHQETVPLILSIQTDPALVYSFKWELFDGAPGLLDSKSAIMYPCAEGED